jgi:nicotinamide mononucleotide adenylyltransferase
VAFLPGLLPSHISDSSDTASAAGPGVLGHGVLAQPQAPGPVRVVLLCGEDLLESMARPGAWHRPELILERYGAVCVSREGGGVRRMMSEPGNLLHSHRGRITLLEDPVPNAISATLVRAELAAGRPVRYLVPEQVRRYIGARGLYGCKEAGA